MKICGVIAEYNPFHNGHAHQLACARRASACDYLIVCMGGSLSQRGDVMLLDKWTRAQAALENGADLVVELPALFAVRNAEAFARGGVLTLDGLCASALSFGCETDDLALLERLCRAFHAESDSLSQAIRQGLDQGKSHARARGEAIARALDVSEALVASPNVTLAVEYMRAAASLARKPSLYPVARQGGYHDPSLGRFASASAIRRAVLDSGLSGDVRASLPLSSADALSDCLNTGHFARGERLDATLLYLLRTRDARSLAALTDVSEGMERLFIKHAPDAGTRDGLLDQVKCKRYTRARLNRFCAHALLNLTAEAVARHPVPEYARVLGFRKDARALLGYLKRNARLPLVTDPVRLRGSELFHYDCLATDLQALAMDNAAFRAAGQDFTHALCLCGAPGDSPRSVPKG